MECGVDRRATTSTSVIVLVAAILIAAGYLMIRVFDRLAPAPAIQGDDAGASA